jgi:hypothetical protein
MARLLEKLGALFDWIVGNRSTVEFTGAVANRQVTLRSDTDDKVAIVATITQVTFVTHYQRWWLLPSKETVYRVHLEAPDHIRANLDPRLFEPQTFPRLCNSLLMDTEHPHTYALHAFLDHISPLYPTITCEL